MDRSDFINIRRAPSALLRVATTAAIITAALGCGGITVMTTPEPESAQQTTVDDTTTAADLGDHDPDDSQYVLGDDATSAPVPKPKAKTAAPARKQNEDAAAPAAPPIPSITVGGKAWMKRNLDIKTDGSWCYDHSSANCRTYGRLYSWNAAVKACADLGDGWRLPNDDDWNSLIESTGDRKTAGTKLKSSRVWKADNEGKIIVGTDDLGFTALPGGYRYSNGDFISVDTHGYWWSAEEAGNDYAAGQSMGNINEYVTRSNSGKIIGFSVRCVRDL